MDTVGNTLFPFIFSTAKLSVVRRVCGLYLSSYRYQHAGNRLLETEITIASAESLLRRINQRIQYNFLSQMEIGPSFDIIFNRLSRETKLQQSVFNMECLSIIDAWK